MALTADEKILAWENTVKMIHGLLANARKDSRDATTRIKSLECAQYHLNLMQAYMTLDIKRVAQELARKK